MSKVVYNGKTIVLKDKLDKGELELDLIVNEQDINLEDTIEFDTNLIEVKENE